MEKSQGGQAVTPVSIPPDPYQRALKELRLASEELREANERIKRLEDALEARASDNELNEAWELYIKTKEAKL
jgi:hypothetical protein